MRDTKERFRKTRSQLKGLYIKLSMMASNYCSWGKTVISKSFLNVY